MHTHTGKRVVSNSIILSYWVIPVGALPGISPDAFVAALHTTWECLITNNRQFLVVIPIAIYHERCGNGLSNRFKQKQNNCCKPKLSLKNPLFIKKKKIHYTKVSKILHMNTQDYAALKKKQNKLLFYDSNPKLISTRQTIITISYDSTLPKQPSTKISNSHAALWRGFIGKGTHLSLMFECWWTKKEAFPSIIADVFRSMSWWIWNKRCPSLIKLHTKSYIYAH